MSEDELKSGIIALATKVSPGTVHLDRAYWEERGVKDLILYVSTVKFGGASEWEVGAPGAPVELHYVRKVPVCACV